MTSMMPDGKLSLIILCAVAVCTLVIVSTETSFDPAKGVVTAGAEKVDSVREKESQNVPHMTSANKLPAKRTCPPTTFGTSTTDHEILPAPDLPPGFIWREVTDKKLLEQYESQSVYYSHVSGQIGGNMRIKGRLWKTSYQGDTFEDNLSAERRFTDNVGKFMSENGWSIRQNVHDFTLSGILADHPTGAGETVGYVNAHKGALRAVVVNIAREFERDPRTAEEHGGDILGIRSLNLTLYLSDVVPLSEVLPDYSPSALLGVLYADTGINDASRKGVVVEDVVDASPAAKAKIRKGDVIIAIEGQSLSEERTISSLIGNYCPGDEINVQVQSPDGVRIEPVTLAEY